MSESKDDQSWRSRAERGSVIGAHFMLWLATSLGRGATRLMLRPLMLYYTLTAGAAKLAVRSFLRRVDGSEPSFGRVYTQFLRLAQMMLDAILLLRGKRHHFRFTRTGKHHFAEMAKRDRGAILLGAHHGSMYAMRALAGDEALPIRAVVYTKHAALFNSLLARMDPESQARLIQMGEGVDS